MLCCFRHFSPLSLKKSDYIKPFRLSLKINKLRSYFSQESLFIVLLLLLLLLLLLCFVCLIHDLQPTIKPFTNDESHLLLTKHCVVDIEIINDEVFKMSTFVNSK
jgi:hypothetical protein